MPVPRDYPSCARCSRVGAYIRNCKYCSREIDLCVGHRQTTGMCETCYSVFRSRGAKDAERLGRRRHREAELRRIRKGPPYVPEQATLWPARELSRLSLEGFLAGGQMSA